MPTVSLSYRAVLVALPCIADHRRRAKTTEVVNAVEATEHIQHPVSLDADRPLGDGTVLSPSRRRRSRSQNCRPSKPLQHRPGNARNC